ALQPNHPDAATVPQSARSTFDAAGLNLDVSRALTHSITADIASAEAALAARRRALAEADKKETEAHRVSRTRLEWRNLGIAFGAVTALMLVASAGLALALKRASSSIRTGWIVQASLVTLSTIIIYDLFGAPAIMLAALIVGALMLRAIAKVP